MLVKYATCIDSSTFFMCAHLPDICFQMLPAMMISNIHRITTCICFFLIRYKRWTEEKLCVIFSNIINKILTRCATCISNVLFVQYRGLLVVIFAFSRSRLCMPHNPIKVPQGPLHCHLAATASSVPL